MNYDADVTWNENTFFNKKDNIGNLVWNALILCGILMVFALVAGIAFGGLRVLVQRIIPGTDFPPRRAGGIHLPSPLGKGVQPSGW